MRRDHLADCARLYVAIFNRPPWNGRWTARTAAQHIEESFRDPGFRGIVALEDTAVIGFAYGLIFQWENERRFYAEAMCVRDGRQCNGVGTRLLSHLMKKLNAEHVRQISLSTGRHLPVKAFYLKLGFAINPEVIIMTKRLPKRAKK